MTAKKYRNREDLLLEIQELKLQLESLGQVEVPAGELPQTDGPEPGMVRIVVDLEERHAQYLDDYRRATCYSRGIDPESDKPKPDGWSLADELSLLVQQKYAADPVRSLGTGAATGPAKEFNTATGSW